MEPDISISTPNVPKVSGIILAAGISSRMGRPKQLLKYKGKTLLQTVVDAATSSVLDETIVVLGHKRELILQTTDFSGVRVIVNKNHAEGQSSSIRAGLSGVSENQNAALFLLSDQPLVTPDLIRTILERYRKTRAGIIVPVENGRRGNPVLIDRKLFEDLKRIKGDTGGRSLFDHHKNDISFLEVPDKGIHIDIDTPDDYQQLLQS
ncbi:molybdenum cofactor cytidylyltransferase [bacterium]|nr:molybdenum cofactor cytidylyltransferase [bacterium]